MALSQKYTLRLTACAVALISFIGCTTIFERTRYFEVTGTITSPQSEACVLTVRSLPAGQTLAKKGISGRFIQRVGVVPDSNDYWVNVTCGYSSYVTLNVRYGFDVSTRKPLALGEITL